MTQSNDLAKLSSIANGMYNTISANATAVTAVCSPVVCATSCICSPTVCASTSVVSPTVCASSCVCSPTVCASTSVVSPTVCASSCVCSPTVCASTSVVSPVVCASTCLCSPTICASTSVVSPTVCGSTAVISPTVCGSTAICSPTLCGTTSVVSPVVCASSCLSAVAVCATNLYGNGAGLSGVGASVGQITYFPMQPANTTSYLATNSGEYLKCDYPTLSACLCNLVTYSNLCIPVNITCPGAGSYFTQKDGICVYYCFIACNGLSLICCVACTCESMTDSQYFIAVGDKGQKVCKFIHPYFYGVLANTTFAIRPDYARECCPLIFNCENYGDGRFNYGGLSNSNACGTVFMVAYSSLTTMSCVRSTATKGVIAICYDQVNKCVNASGCLYPACCDQFFCIVATCDAASVAQGTLCLADGCVGQVLVQFTSCAVCVPSGQTFYIPCANIIHTSKFDNTSVRPRLVCVGGCLASGSGCRIKNSVGKKTYVSAGTSGWTVVGFANGAPCCIACYSCAVCSLDYVTYDYDNDKFIAARLCSLHYSCDGATWTLGANTIGLVCTIERVGACKILAITSLGCGRYITCDGGITWACCCGGAINPDNCWLSSALTPDGSAIRYHNTNTTKIIISNLSGFCTPNLINMIYDPTTSSYIGISCCCELVCNPNLCLCPWVCKSIFCSCVLPLFNVKDREVYGVFKNVANLSYMCAKFDTLQTIVCSTPCCIVDSYNCPGTYDSYCTGLICVPIGDCYSGRIAVMTCSTNQSNSCLKGRVITTTNKGTTWSLYSCFYCDTFTNGILYDYGTSAGPLTVCFLMNKLHLSRQFSALMHSVQLSWCDGNDRIAVLARCYNGFNGVPCAGYVLSPAVCCFVGAYWNPIIKAFAPIPNCSDEGGDGVIGQTSLFDGVSFIDNHTGEKFSIGKIQNCSLGTGYRFGCLNYGGQACQLVTVNHNVSPWIKTYVPFAECTISTYTCYASIVNGRAFYAGQEEVICNYYSNTFVVPYCPGGYIKT